MTGCYLLINPDGSINYASEGAMDAHLHREGLSMIQCKDKTWPELVGDIPALYAHWDAQHQCVFDIRDRREDSR